MESREVSEQKSPNKRLHLQTEPNAESIVGNHSTGTSCFLRAASGCKSLQCMAQELYNWLVCSTTGKHRKTLAIKNPLVLHYCSSPCSLAAQTDDRSTPDRGTRYGVCEENQSDCVENKCVIFAHERPLCTECKSGKIPIDGECVDANSV
ncbi:Molecular chaperone, DnaJ family protein [Giardia duodenalis]|uniref:Molecular chaperone, DnaJ family protein n=1 Tax=Giardia intestinalis TaxID=5741 RepID=V6TDC5_GIAIN|nr:Molecular chaperone, DnaJ family protein [Giardia intestinalis]